MQLPLDGNSEHVCASMKENRSLRGKKIVSALDLIKCLENINLQRLFLTCATISELPPNIQGIMIKSIFLCHLVSKGMDGQAGPEDVGSLRERWKRSSPWSSPSSP